LRGTNSATLKLVGPHLIRDQITRKFNATRA
jgi:hypothetical protein